MDIIAADTDAERLEVCDFHARHILGIVANAVPSLANDEASPIVVYMRATNGEIAPAALTCRAQLAADAATGPVASWLRGTYQREV